MPPQASRLLQLPSDLFCMVWDHLRPTDDDDDSSAPQDQHALRCTCRQARDATTSLVSAAEVRFDYREAREPAQAAPGWEGVLQAGLRQLAAFPAAATLTSLTWEYWGVKRHGSSDEEGGGGQGGRRHVLLPELLPSFLVAAQGRLAGLEVVKLVGNLALGYGEVSSLVECCPRLMHLTLLNMPLLNPALHPLARLTGLRSLTLDFVKPTSDAGIDPLQSLSLLSATSSLMSLAVDGLSAEKAEKVMPHIAGLSSLRDLKLRRMYERQDGGDTPLYTFSSLTRLTSLHLGLFIQPPARPTLALPAQLLLLDLDGMTLTATAIRVVAALPHLTELTVAELAPDCDLSHLLCHYSKLTLRQCSSHLQLTWLPLQSVKLLRIGWCWWQPRLTWCLDPASDAANTHNTLSRACQVLASTTACDRLTISLIWKDVPSYPSAPLLAALAPLAQLPAREWLALVLSAHWGVSSEHVHQLAIHLPNLSALQVQHSEANFASFAAAVGCKLARLRLLSLKPGSARLSSESQLAMMALASVRVTSGLPLTLDVGRGMSREERERCNAVVESLRDGVGKAQHNLVVFTGC